MTDTKLLAVKLSVIIGALIINVLLWVPLIAYAWHWWTL